jgi:hypothetical protein
MPLEFSQHTRIKNRIQKKEIFNELLQSFENFSPLKSNQLIISNQIQVNKNINFNSIMKITSTTF